MATEESKDPYTGNALASKRPNAVGYAFTVLDAFSRYQATVRFKPSSNPTVGL